MSTLFPAQIDGYSQLRVLKDGVDEIVALDNNNLRSAVVAIEQTLGTNPQASFATVSARLDSTSGASAAIAAHLAATSDAHPASAITIADVANKYVAIDVEGALTELAAVLPSTPNVIGSPSTTMPNTGVPDFVAHAGTLFLYNLSGGSNVLTKTQPVTNTGIMVIEIGAANGTGTGAALQFSTLTPASVQWCAPGDAWGVAVDVSGLAAGDVAIVSSNDTTKSIRIVRTAASFPLVVPAAESFEVLRLSAVPGAFSDQGVGIVASNFLTRTAYSSTATSREQFVISGTVYPADQGTLVLQRKLRSSGAFYPIAILDLGANFTEAKRTTGQPVYAPTLSAGTPYDTIMLYDRLPMKNDYSAHLNANGTQVYTNYNLVYDFPAFQVAKYVIPVSNPNLIGGELQAPSSTSQADVDGKVSAYRIVHFVPGQSGADFNGNPTAEQIFSIQDALGSANDGDNNVRLSNVFVDTNTTRPGIITAQLSKTTDAELTPNVVSGIHYYGTINDKFNFGVRTTSDLFLNSYPQTGIIANVSGSLIVPETDNGFSALDLMNDSKALYSNSNLPGNGAINQDGYYFADAVYNTALGRPFPDYLGFSTNAGVGVTVSDPFGACVRVDAYGGSDIKWICIAAGAWHTAAIKNDGTLWYWGDTGDINSGSSHPVQLDSGKLWVSVVCGTEFTIALKSDGTLWGIGHNDVGQLGIGGGAGQQNTLTQIGSDTNWSSVTAGYAHALAIKTTGTLWAWGTNGNGQLGDSTIIQRNAPVQIGAGTNWSSVSAGFADTAAVKSDGTLWQWGSGSGVFAEQHAPTKIGTDTNWSRVAVGTEHAVALKTTGTLWAWGVNSSGELGDGSTDASLPEQIGADTNWSAISAGFLNTLATKTTRTLWACGDNTYGQLGDGTTTQQNTLVQVGSAATWSMIGAGSGHTLGLNASGDIYACGLNSSGQLGDWTTTQRNTLVQVAGGYRILVNSSGRSGSGPTEECFANELMRNGTAETYASALAPGQYTSRNGANPANGYTLAAWDNTATLAFGELQVGGLFSHDQDSGGLVFPQDNYNISIAPTQGVIDYSNVGYQVDSIYQRLFVPVGSDRIVSSGKLRIKSTGGFPIGFSDIDATNADRDLKIEIKVPGSDSNSTGWLDLGSRFQYGRFYDGAGCMIGVDGDVGGFTVSFNLAPRSCIGTGNLLAVRVTYFGARFSSARNRILSYLGLS